MKHLASLLIFLIIAIPVTAKAQNAVKDFPVVDEGAFFVYDIESEFNTSTGIRIRGFTLVTYSWRYDIIEVTDDYVKLNVSWKRYVNGTYSDSGGYITKVLLPENRSTMFFHVFYNISCIYDAVEYAIKLYAGVEGEYNIEDIICLLYTSPSPRDRG